MAYQAITNPNRGLKPYDGMSAAHTTEVQRAVVLDKMLDEPSADCLKYGFYIGEYWAGPIPGLYRKMCET